MENHLKSLFFGAICLAASPTLGQGNGAAPSQGGGYGKPVQEWSVRLGAFGMLKPEYDGSDEYEVTGFPDIDIRWRDFVFLNGRDGFGVRLWDDGMLSLATSVGYVFGRDHDKSDDLNGLGDIEGGAAAIVRGGLKYRGFSFTTRLSHQFTGDDTGVLADFGLGYSWRSRHGWFVRPGLKASYASGEYMDRYFSITTGQSGSSGLPAYDADAGFKSVGLGLMGGYAFDRNWSITTRASWDRLIGDAADSPVVKDKDQFSLGAGISYRF